MNLEVINQEKKINVGWFCKAQSTSASRQYCSRLSNKYWCQAEEPQLYPQRTFSLPTSPCCVCAWEFVTAQGQHNTEPLRLGGAGKEFPGWRSTAVPILEPIAGAHPVCHVCLCVSLTSSLLCVDKKRRRVWLWEVVGRGWCFWDEVWKQDDH